MSRRYFAVGVFIVAGMTLLALGIFLVGNRHEAFSHHILLYTDFADLDGITKGSKVQVAGMDAGQVTKIEIPNSPNGRFRVLMKVDEHFHGLVRTDSVVTADTEGVVGNTFLTIHAGSPNAPSAPAGSTLQSKVPVNMTDLLSNGMRIMNDADTTLRQVSGKLNLALGGVNTTISNANELLIGIKEGRGPVGMLLRDEKMAGQIRETMSNVQSATSNFNHVSTRVDSFVADVQQRQFPQRLDDTIAQIRSASTQASETIDQVHLSLAQALGPDANGMTAGENISQSLTNINIATGNMADDTEALKHNFFLKGFFNHRGYYNLANLSPLEYRRSPLFANSHSSRVWLRAESIFRHGTNRSLELTEGGKRAIDAAVGSFGDLLFKHPLVVEGYSDEAAPSDKLAESFARAQIVRNYIEARYPFIAKNAAAMPLSETPPPGLEHDHWSGVCLLIALTK